MLPILLLVPLTSGGQTPPGTAPAAAMPGTALVERALANELRAAEDASKDPSHMMQYRLRKTSPRLTSTKQIVETPDGAVARLIAIYDKPLSPVDEQKEQARLDQDTERAMKVLRALAQAFTYQFADYEFAGMDASSSLAKFTFKPNPAFSPQDLETEALTQVAGEIWIDMAHLRVTRLEGRLIQDVDFGWGILGRLDKGGSIAIDQCDVGGGQWRIRRFKMAMTGRVLFRTKSFDTEEEETEFSPVPPGTGYRKAIEMLRAMN